MPSWWLRAAYRWLPPGGRVAKSACAASTVILVALIIMIWRVPHRNVVVAIVLTAAATVVFGVSVLTFFAGRGPLADQIRAAGAAE